MPSAQHFFYDLFSAERGDRTDIINFLACTYENVHDFITRAWGLSQYPTPRDWRSMNVEDVFSFLDVGERMLRKGTGYHAAFSKSKEYLLDLIWLLLDMKCSGQHCEHLSSVFHDIDPSDSIISYNWNTIADRTLSHFDRPQHKNYVQLMSADHFRLRDYSSKGVLLKLHGSLSWVLCSNRKCPASKKPLLVDAKCEGRLSLDKAYEKCPTCGTPRPKPFIVPPTSSKPIDHNSFLHRLWMLAREKVGWARRLVFIGYSFAPTDYHSESLFRHVQFLKGPRPLVVVVNPDIFRPRSPVAQRYKSIFRGRTIKKFRTLADFAHSPGGLSRLADPATAAAS